MRTEFSTGYASGVHAVDSLPSVGDVVHRGEFIYTVCAVVHQQANQTVVVELEPLPQIPDLEHEVAILEFKFDGTANVPRAGDIYDHNPIHVVHDDPLEGRFRVVRLQWFLNQRNIRGYPLDDSVVVEMTPLIEEDPGLVRRDEGVESYGQRVVASGISPM